MSLMQTAEPETTQQKAAIQTKDLHFYYGKVHALKEINLGIKRNQVTALIGPSGCGKSTFLRTLNKMNAFIPKTRVEGEVMIGGRNIYSPGTDEARLRKEVGMVFQQANPFFSSIYDNVAYGPRLHGETNKQTLDERVESSLRSAALWDEVKDDLKKEATGLSGGQQQRLVLARVLAVKPDMILMDEPTSALDPLSTRKLEELVIGLKEDYTIVVVTHNMQQAARISDETAFFLNGEVLEFDRTDRVFTNPANQKTEDYISGRFG